MINRNETSLEYSFVDLISKYKIEIPILQRDYVQGRRTDVVDEIRENFVKDLITHVTSDSDKTLPLDFIYGYADDELNKYDREIAKKNIKSLLDTIQNFSSLERFELTYSVKDSTTIDKNVFVPLDGQQRLTTLFLLHFYVLLCHAPDKIILLKDRLKYKTRKSSEQFISKLLENYRRINLRLPIADAIEDAGWFVASWKRDPTVDGILVMLAEIEKQFKAVSAGGEKISTAYNHLFNKKSISFDFLDMNEHGLSDDIYLKMNSSGKPLSDYDNFKAWFVGKVKHIVIENPDLIEEPSFMGWEEHLDQDWYNIFWLIDQTKADELMYQFIKSILSYSLMIDSNFHDEKLQKESFELLNNGAFIPLKFYDEHKLISKENIFQIFTVFRSLTTSNNTFISNICDVWTNTFSGGAEYRYEILRNIGGSSLLNKTFFYATIRLLCVSSTLKENDFRKWVRVFRNITYNTRIDDFSRFENSIQKIHQFVNSENLIDLNDERWIEAFDGKQVKEEFFKYKIEKALPDTIKVFEEAESHFYLFGQIYFLVDWCMEPNFVLPLFEKFFYRFQNLFSKNHLDSQNYLLQRAFLTVSKDWMPDKGSWRFSFCKNSYSSARERDENWRLVFSERSSIVRWFLNNSIDSSEKLLKLVEDSKCKVDDWRYFFINDSTLIKKCGERLINFGSNGNFIRLLDKTKLSGYHAELRTWVLFQLLKDGKYGSCGSLDYFHVNSGEKDCRIHFVELNFYLRYDRVHFKLVCEAYDALNEKFVICEDEPLKELISLSEIYYDFNLYLSKSS